MAVNLFLYMGFLALMVLEFANIPQTRLLLTIKYTLGIAWLILALYSGIHIVTEQSSIPTLDKLV